MSTLTRIAGHLLRRYVSPYVVIELLLAWNATRCRPPLRDKDIMRIVNFDRGPGAAEAQAMTADNSNIVRLAELTQRLLPAPSAPMEVATYLRRACYPNPTGASTLRSWRGGWWEWRAARLVRDRARAVRQPSVQVRGTRALRNYSTGTRPSCDLGTKPVQGRRPARRTGRGLPPSRSTSTPVLARRPRRGPVLVSLRERAAGPAHHKLHAHTPLYFNLTDGSVRLRSRRDPRQRDGCTSWTSYGPTTRPPSTRWASGSDM